MVRACGLPAEGPAARASAGRGALRAREGPVRQGAPAFDHRGPDSALLRSFRRAESLFAAARA
eukprot:1351763-Alexandrium_andersonii.AAC.1